MTIIRLYDTFIRIKLCLNLLTEIEVSGMITMLLFLKSNEAGI